MVIICTVLGAAAPSLRGFFVSRQTDQAAARIMSLTRLARSQSVAEGRVYRLNLAGADRTYYLTRQGESGFEQLGSSLGMPFRLPKGVELEARDPGGSLRHVTFHPDGRIEPAVIRLTDIKGGVVEVYSTAPTEPFAIRTAEEVAP